MLKKTTFILFVLLLSMLPGFAQFNFQRILGGPDHDRAQTIINTFDNGYLVNGASFSFGSGDVDATLFKLDNQGQMLWGYAYGTNGFDNSEYAIETFDHKFVCAGRSNLSANTSAIIFKTDSAGLLLWSKSYGGNANDGFSEIIETSDHGYAAVGYTKDVSTSEADVLFIRTDLNGDTLFTHAYGTALSEEGLSLIQLPDDGFLLSGRQVDYSSGIPESDGLLIRTDANGNLVWSKLYGDSLWEELTSVKQTIDSGYIVTGSTVTFGAGDYDVLLMKTDTSGNVSWSETFGGVKTDAAYDIHITADQSYVLSGYTESLGYGHRGADSTNVFLLKTDGNGAFQWMEVYGDGLQDEAYRSNKASDGGYVVSGYTRNYLPQDSTQMFVIKTDSMGNTGCHEESVQPVDSMITMPYQTISLNQFSGFSFGAFVLNTIPAGPADDDACFFTNINSGISEKEKMFAFPNPFSDRLEITFDENNLPGDVLIISDICGKKIKTIDVNSSNLIIETSELRPGVYVISKSGKESASRSILVVKN